MQDQIEVSTVVTATPADVWRALTDASVLKRYFFGADVKSTWQPGSPITWEGEFHGKKFKDKGTIVAVEPQRRLEMTHWSPLSSLEDRPENYHTLVWEIEPQGRSTQVRLTQRNLTGVAPADARKSWQPVMEGLKSTLEA